jgi:hypothetical protein
VTRLERNHNHLEGNYSLVSPLILSLLPSQTVKGFLCYDSLIVLTLDFKFRPTTTVHSIEILSPTYCDKFGAERRHRKDGTILTFDPEKLVKVGRLYKLETKIQTKVGEGGEGGDNSEGSKKSMVVTTLPNNNNEEETRMISPQGAQKSVLVRASAVV